MKKDRDSQQTESFIRSTPIDQGSSSESLDIPNDLGTLQNAYQKLLHERDMLRKTLYAIRSSFPLLRF